jgi:ABC-2 type transport system permease protein
MSSGRARRSPVGVRALSADNRSTNVPGGGGTDLTVDGVDLVRERGVSLPRAAPGSIRVRYPGLSMFTILGPVVILLLTVFVFGSTLGAGLPGADPSGRRDSYLAYVMPGILLITIAGTVSGVSTTVAMDMTEGVTARFRTMAISRGAVLAGHVLGNTIQAVIAVALVLGVGMAVGFRPSAGPGEWLAAVGLIVLISFALSWIGVAMGMQSKTFETASNLPLILALLPLLGSGFNPLLAIGWCIVIRVAGYVWSMAIYERKSVR